MNATALIAEDEPLLAAHLQDELQRQWPALRIVASVGHGEAAVQQALALQPQVLFLDIRMPGMTGLEAAQALAEEWPQEHPFPLLVFVTAYDQYALQAFEQAAIDYVLKPLQADRLAQTCARLQQSLATRQQTAPASAPPAGAPSTPNTAPNATLDATLAQLRLLLGQTGPQAEAATPKLQVLQAGVGNTIHMVRVDDVLYFEAADKYVRVVTAEREHLIRISLRELIPQLDAHRFWQIHRGTVVRADAVTTAVRDESGKLTLSLRDHRDKLTVSRLYAHLFKAL